MDAPEVLEILEVELARKKTEIKRMAKWLREKKLAVKRKRKELQRIKRVNKEILAMNIRMEKMVDDFLVAAEDENSDPEAAKIWTEKAMKEVIKGMKDLNLEGDN